MSLNNAVIVQTIGYDCSKNVYHKLYNSAVDILILICAGSLPGYRTSVFAIDTMGRKPIQMFGFFILIIFYYVISVAYHRLNSNSLLGLYIICQFFQNFGPNTTTFISPGEIFPTRYTSIAHGISVASGKVGAIIVQTILNILVNNNCNRDCKQTNCWLPHVMEIFALIVLCGFFLSFLIPELKGMVQEEVSEKYHGEMNISNYGSNVRIENMEQSTFSDYKQNLE